MAKEDSAPANTAPPAGVAAVVGRLRQIEQVWQLQGDFHRLPISAQGDCRAEFAIFQTSGELADDGTELVATVELGCRLTAEVEDTSVIPEEFLDKDSGGRAVIAFVHGSYMITYGLNEGGGLSDDDVGEFCAVNGVHTAWPFWREFVTSSLTRSGLEAVPVPPFTIFGSHKPAVTSKPAESKPHG
jgi:hypothetical protein